MKKSKTFNIFPTPIYGFYFFGLYGEFAVFTPKWFSLYTNRWFIKGKWRATKKYQWQKIIVNERTKTQILEAIFISGEKVREYV